MLSFGLDRSPQLFSPLVYCPVNDTVFEVRPEIRGLGVSSRHCCYENHAAADLRKFKNLLP